MPTLVLFQPKIPPNTGNIMRLCSNTGFNLHLIKPFGFSLDEKSLRRAKLDYFSDTNPLIFEDLESYCNNINTKNLLLITKYGIKNYTEATFTDNSIIIFGSETNGLPKKFVESYRNKSYKIPMLDESRSLNLSNAAAIIAYEAWKSLNFSSASH
ncbi:MAG: tRNA (cytidine(34)-2'-O)-methyltransferase [Alphaproteobacteria bacterium MarineAlpha9_Bin4]|nr:tRNA (uridine(34)/cytosine(34)/5-carboxymethylaminomethyluridine(34)-2'-O)-methyltransferase TrmL [Pelagibacterales bacterium]PPR27359.1 MAG: tRNA (cytidine(34)-2'-O)-methyltransferase [Alphaproteobacteria bacterium MarineAlpha9_Bin4]|tara:strand:+ start:1426 stop:1890 length:465 start_codon:yes stop_codon:yes gene_type:complete